VNVGKEVGAPSYWMKCDALPENTCSCCPKEINQCPCMFSICFKPDERFCSCFELFILVGFQNIGYHLLCLFLLVMLLCTVVVCSNSAIFIWSYKVTFSEK